MTSSAREVERQYTRSSVKLLLLTHCKNNIHWKRKEVRYNLFSSVVLSCIFGNINQRQPKKQIRSLDLGISHSMQQMMVTQVVIVWFITPLQPHDEVIETMIRSQVTHEMQPRRFIIPGQITTGTGRSTTVDYIVSNDNTIPWLTKMKISTKYDFPDGGNWIHSQQCCYDDTCLCLYPFIFESRDRFFSCNNSCIR